MDYSSIYNMLKKELKKKDYIHSLRVKGYCAEIVEVLEQENVKYNFTAEEKNILYSAALLHDFGKRKERKKNHSKKEIKKNHPKYGFNDLQKDKYQKIFLQCFDQKGKIDIILKIVKNHKEYESNEDEYSANEQLFFDIVRAADVLGKINKRKKINKIIHALNNPQKIKNSTIRKVSFQILESLRNY